jgi:cell division protein FtsI/penicillin-binding protein 2
MCQNTKVIKGHYLGKLLKAVKLSVTGKSLSKAGAFKMPRKKTILIIVGIISFITFLILALFIALIIWFVGLFNSDQARETVNSAQSMSQSIVQPVNPQSYIDSNGQVDTRSLQEKVNSFPESQVVQWSESFRIQVIELLTQGKIIQSQADQLLNIIPQ